MPYIIRKVTGGYKVAKEKPEANGRYRYFSKDPMTKAEAEKQLTALNISYSKEKMKRRGK